MGAEAFFATQALPLGTISAGVQSSVSLSYDLTFNAGTLANVGDGFGFSYELIDPPTPEDIERVGRTALHRLG